jgi:chromosome segregation ATPase
MQLEEQNATAESLRRQVDESREQITAQTAKLAAARHESQQLTERIAALQSGSTVASAEKLAELRQAKADLEARRQGLADQEAELDALKRSSSSSESRLVAQLAAAAAEADKLRHQLGEKTSSAEIAQTQLTAANARLAELDAEVFKLQAETKDARDRLKAAKPPGPSSAETAELAALRQKAAAGEQAIVALQATRKQYEIQVAEFSRATAEAAKLRQQLSEKTSSADAAQTQLTAANGKLAALDAQVLKLQAETKDAREQLKAVRSTVPTSAETAELAALRQKAAAGEQAIVALQATRKQYETQVADFTRATAEAAKLRQQLSQQLSEKTSGAQAAQTQLAAANAKLAVLDAQVLKLQAETKDAQAQLKAVKSAGPSSAEVAELAALRQKAAAGEQAIVALQATRKQYEAQIADFTRTAAANHEQLQGSRAQIASLQQRALESEQRLSEANQRLLEQEQQLIADRGRLAAAQASTQQMRTLETTLAEREAKLGEQRSIIAGLQAEADSYRSEIGRLKSLPPVVQVASVSAPATRSARVQIPPDILGTYHALVIGNDSYNFMPNLTTAVSDADAVAKVLRTKYGFETHVLHNATNDEIMTAVNDYRKTLRSDDNLLIYYAGHGELDEKNYRGYWLPVNAKRDDMTAWISDQMITGQLNAMVARHVLVVADSCYAGAMTRSGGVQLVSKGGDDAEIKRLRYLAGRQSRTVLTSGGAAPVVDVGPGGHSIFARAFVDALEKNSQILEGAELYNDIFDVVRSSAKRLFQFDQSPRYEKIRDAGHQNGEFLFVPRST